MFPIDVTLLPSLATRKALIVVDAQNDFLAEDGALPVKMPVDLSQRISDLANNFRKNGGEVIWVQSRFESSRPLEGEQIMASDTPSPAAGSAPARGRRPRPPPPAAEAAPSPEAFLTLDTGKGPDCVGVGTPGMEMHPIVKQAVGPKDHVLVKTYYSAFKAEGLLGLLRVRLVTELFICGSLTNIGVMATAIDAASHGYTITIVDDCCGLRSMSRHRMALRQITSTTGCDTLSAAGVVDTMKPKLATSTQVDRRPQRGVVGGESPTVRVQRGKEGAVAPSVSDIQPSLEKLSLSGQSAAANEHAPKTLSPGQQARSQARRQPQSQSRSPPTVQSVARSGHPQSTNRSGRDPLTPTGMPSSEANGHIPVTPEQSHSSGENPNDCCDESVRPSQDAETAQPSRGSTLPSERRSRQSTPPSLSAALPTASELRPNTKANTNTSVGCDINANQERNNSKSVESLTTTSNGCSPAPSGETPESLATPPKSISRTPRDDTAAEPSPTNTYPMSSEGEISSKMAPPPPPQKTRGAESEPLCQGDTKVIYDILPDALAQGMFERIRNEVSWQRMSHQGGEVPRLVAVQGNVNADGSKPVYRHPADESPPLQPFTPAVDEIRRVVEARLGHPLNHALIQFYRHGNDYISEHSDKTLDIARESFIANVSLGAERTMTLRTKRLPKDAKPGRGDAEKAGPESSPELASADALKRRVQRARLPHNSLFQMGLATNMRWMHAIRQDKRSAREKSEGELAYEGARISLTFRRIATFLDADETHIWGQGATCKTRDGAREVVNGQTDQAVAMLKAFGRENQASEFDWEVHYGGGFDVLHISTAARLFLSSDAIVNMRLQVMLAELGVSYARGSLSTPEDTRSGASVGTPTKTPGSAIDVAVKFVDNDGAKTVVEGHREIMLYLHKTYSAASGGPSDRREERVSDRFQQGLELLALWRSSSSPPTAGRIDIVKLLTPWEKYAAEDDFIAGPKPGLADFAFWPVLHDILSSISPATTITAPTPPSAPKVDDERRDGQQTEAEKGKPAIITDVKEEPPFPGLLAYNDRMRATDAVVRILAASQGA